MATNRFFNNHKNRPEQNLVEDLIIETIKMAGIDCYFIPRTIVNIDELFGEDTISKYASGHMIEMYIESYDGFEGDGDFISKFGLEIRDDITLSVSKRRLKEVLYLDGLDNIERPREGDLVYFPLNKGLFEIKFVEHEKPFYQLGKGYVYTIRAELFRYSQEEFDTDIPEVDIIGDIDINSDNFGDNQTIEDEADNIQDFTEKNPFGEF